MKMKFWHFVYLYQILNPVIKCNNREGIKSKNKLPYFRREINENLGNLDTKDSRSESDDLQSHIVSFLINNVKEIFRENDEITEFSVSPLPFRASEIVSQSTKKTINIEEDPKLTDDIKGYRNMSLSTLVNMNPPISPDDIKKAKHSHMLLLSESSLRKSEQKLVHNNTYVLVSSLAPEPVSFLEHAERGRSCIFCNNVVHEDCDNPTNKLIPSVVCEHDGDECYSLHTPFGVIDRGCYNINRNLTIYVCACNLCNYLSITEMPYVFSNKREWVHNVVELSRVRNLRKSVFKDMACLSCEVNTTKSKTGLTEENCLDGSIGSLKTEVCNEGEVCAVKVIKGDGYVWRGCVRTPLYNYWWNVCDHDLCNSDTLVYIYDYL